MAMSLLRTTPVNDGFGIDAYAISNDGDIIVGNTANPNGNFPIAPSGSYRWTTGGGFEAVPISPGEPGITGAAASLISGDGNVVAGTAAYVGLSRAFRWNSQEGMKLIPTLPTVTEVTPYNLVLGLSDDGTVLVGQSTSGFNIEAFRWTEDEATVGLAVREISLPMGRR